jgi:LmbE family N-acetylglucosaminyl deacetylase
MTIMAIVAHPDDEVLTCGATLARFAADGEVHIRILGEGITSRYATREVAATTDVAQLWDDAREVGRLLGAKSVELAGLPDNRFDSLALLDVIKQVEAWLAELTPDTVYTHHPGDLNIDHVITARAVLTATRPVAGCPVRDVYAGEVPSASEWAFQSFAPAFRPSVFVDVSATIDTKLEAMRRYEGEARTFPHPRSPEALRAIAKRWGSVAGVPYAEAFELVRSLR